MKKISDEDWEKIFGIEKKDRESEDYKEFVKSIENLSLPPEEQNNSQNLPERIKIPKKSKLAVDDEIDLHGLTVAEASLKLEVFFERAKAEKSRVVLVITGKGKHSDRNPALKPFTEKWLKNQGKNFVKKYGIAPKIHGGEGAFIVFLR